jgi:hypothetical protein
MPVQIWRKISEKCTRKTSDLNSCLFWGLGILLKNDFVGLPFYSAFSWVLLDLKTAKNSRYIDQF